MFEKQDEINLRDYIYVIRKWLWVIVAVLVTIVLIAAIRSLRQIPIYQATARIMIERETPGIVPFKESSWWDDWEEYFQTQQKIITSHALAKKVLQKLEMMEQPSEEQPQEEQIQKKNFSLNALKTHILEFFGGQESPLSETAKASLEEKQVIEGLLDMIMVSPVSDSRLVDVSVISFDREQTTLIANTLVETYIEQNLDVKVNASKEAVHWLVEEVETARKKMADSEAALQKYKEQYAITSFEERQSIVMQKLSDLSEAVNNAKIKRITLEARYQELQKYSPEQLESFPEVVENYMVQLLKVDLARRESELSDLQKKFRSKHPNINAVRSQIRSLQKRIEAEVKQVVNSITRENETARGQEQELAKALEEQKQEVLEFNNKAIMYGILRNEAESNRWIYNTLLQKMKETSISERLESSNIRIVDRASIPGFPIAPRRKRDIMLAVVVGIMLGITLAFFLEYLDNTLKTPEDVKQFLGMPFLGFIPKVSSGNMASNGTQYLIETIVANAPKSIVSEAYRSLRTHVTFSLVNHTDFPCESGSIFLITSSEPAEGKSCTVANLGIAMAQSGRKTLIIDCDFRKPVLHRIFNLKTEHGFADVIMNWAANGNETRVWIKQTKMPNLDVIPCGKIPSNPSELLGLPSTQVIITALRKKYDVILLDSPPVNTVTDPVILSGIANGVIIIIRAGQTKREVVQHAQEQLRSAGATILGGVLNSVDIQKNKYSYYAYYYSHYYHYHAEDTLLKSSMQKKKLANRPKERELPEVKA